MITNKEELKTFIKQELGYPVIDINVADEQIEQQIDKAIQKYQKNHFDGWIFDTEIVSLTSNIAEYTLNSDIYNVIDILYNGVGSDSNYEAILYNPWDFFYARGYGGSMDVTSFYLLQEKMRLIETRLRTKYLFTYQYSTNKFKLHPAPTTDSTIALIVQRFNDPYEYVNIYNDDWLKEYATALVGIQWGLNMNKFQGAILPGGATINSQGILDYYKGEKDRLEQQLQDMYTEPPSPMIG